MKLMILHFASYVWLPIKGKLNRFNLDKVFVIKGFSNWKDASAAFKKHSSKCMRDSVDVVIKLPKATKLCLQNMLKIRITAFSNCKFCCHRLMRPIEGSK